MINNLHFLNQDMFLNNVILNVLESILIIFNFFLFIINNFAERKKLVTCIKALTATIMFFGLGYLFHNYLLAIIIVTLILLITILVDDRKKDKLIRKHLQASNDGKSARHYTEFNIGEKAHRVVRDQCNKFIKLAERELSENCPRDALQHLELCNDKAKDRMHYLILYAQGLMMLGDFQNALNKLNRLMLKKKRRNIKKFF